MTKHSAGCQCGHVQLVVDGTPNGVTNCHCSQCQKASGAPYVTWVEFGDGQVTWISDEPTWYASSDLAERGFCPKCGTPMAFRYSQGRDIDLPSVLFDSPETFPPQDEVWTDSRRGWSVLVSSLPHHKKDRES